MSILISLLRQVEGQGHIPSPTTLTLAHDLYAAS